MDVSEWDRLSDFVMRVREVSCDETLRNVDRQFLKRIFAKFLELLESATVLQSPLPIGITADRVDDVIFNNGEIMYDRHINDSSFFFWGI